MVLIPIRCPYCQGDHVIKGGKTDTEKQRYRCQNTHCPHRSFLLDPAYNCGDGIHPSPIGYFQMGKSVDLGLFLRR